MDYLYPYKGFYRLNRSLLQTCQITAWVNLVSKNHCGQKFALSVLLLKVWAEFHGKSRINKKSEKVYLSTTGFSPRNCF